MYDAAIAHIASEAPKVAQVLNLATARESEVVRESEASPTLMFDGVRLTSSYDRRFEALYQAGRIPEDSPAVRIYGWGLGDLQRFWLAKDSLKQLEVVLLNPEITRAALEQFEAMDWMSDRRVSLVCPEDITDAQTPFVASAGELTFANDQHSDIARQIVETLHYDAPQTQDLAEALEMSACAYLMGLNTVGAELLVTFTDLLTAVLEAGQSEETVLGFIELIRLMVDAQKRHDYMHVADLLLYEFRPAIT